MAMRRVNSAASSARALLRWFEHVAYMRSCDQARRANEGQTYKKGYEVRFLLDSKADVREVRRLVRAVGLRPGAPYVKHQRIVQPVYGAMAFDWFLSRLPSGRKRTAMGFSRRGRRIVRRDRSPEVRSARPRPLA